MREIALLNLRNIIVVTLSNDWFCLFDVWENVWDWDL